MGRPQIPVHTRAILLGKHTSARALGMEQLSALCPSVARPSTAMTDEPDATSPDAPSMLGVSSLDALSADTSCTGTLTLPSKAVKMTTPAPLALPSILDSSPPTPPLFPLVQQ